MTVYRVVFPAELHLEEDTPAQALRLYREWLADNLTTEDLEIVDYYGGGPSPAEAEALARTSVYVEWW